MNQKHLKRIQSLGGQKMAFLQREEAIKSYYLNPKICLNCNSIIYHQDGVSISQTKRKKFCDHICSSIFNNKLRFKKVKVKTETKLRQQREIQFLLITKQQLFQNRKNWQSARSTIAKHARNIILKSNIIKQCNICQYNKHVEVCHIKSVASFPEEALISEINDISNLQYLCPNHHWELDHL